MRKVICLYCGIAGIDCVEIISRTSEWNVVTQKWEVDAEHPDGGPDPKYKCRECRTRDEWQYVRADFHVDEIEELPTEVLSDVWNTLIDDLDEDDDYEGEFPYEENGWMRRLKSELLLVVPSRTMRTMRWRHEQGCLCFDSVSS
jgi:hypothetical protein